MEFVVGRDNFALTIFMPVNCKNNCSFCTSKKDYSVHKPDFEKVIQTIEKLNGCSFTDIVITGGEPFADTVMLGKVIDTVEKNIGYKHIFINTSLPKKYENDILNFLKTDNRISRINVSRHLMPVFLEQVSSDDFIKKVAELVPIRFNCVIFDEDAIEEFDIIKYVNTYGSIGDINFRADYRKITFENLHTPHHKLFKILDKIYGFKRSTNCHVCHTDVFDDNYKVGHRVALHRGVEHSSVKYNKKIEMNDMIIKQDGRLFYDWSEDTLISDEIFNHVINPIFVGRKVRRVSYEGSTSSGSCGFSVSGGHC